MAPAPVPQWRQVLLLLLGTKEVQQLVLPPPPLTAVADKDRTRQLSHLLQTESEVGLCYTRASMFKLTSKQVRLHFLLFQPQCQLALAALQVQQAQLFNKKQEEEQPVFHP